MKYVRLTQIKPITMSDGDAVPATTAQQKDGCLTLTAQTSSFREFLPYEDKIVSVLQEE